MADPKQAVVDELLGHLEELNREAKDTKRTINSLRRRMGQPPMFEDVEEATVTPSTIKPDLFFGRPVSTAVRDYIEIRGQAVTAVEILAALEQGGFDFDNQGWRKNDRLRSLSITLTKNSQTFVRLPSGAFGLRSMYPNLPVATKKPKDNGAVDVDDEPDAEVTPEKA